MEYGHKYTCKSREKQIYFAFPRCSRNRRTSELCKYLFFNFSCSPDVNVSSLACQRSHHLVFGSSWICKDTVFFLLFHGHPGKDKAPEKKELQVCPNYSKFATLMVNPGGLNEKYGLV